MGPSLSPIANINNCKEIQTAQSCFLATQVQTLPPHLQLYHCVSFTVLHFTLNLFPQFQSPEASSHVYCRLVVGGERRQPDQTNSQSLYLRLVFVKMLKMLRISYNTLKVRLCCGYWLQLFSIPYVIILSTLWLSRLDVTKVAAGVEPEQRLDRLSADANVTGFV